MAKNDIKEMFSSITERYDLLNHLLSFYQDYLWRRFAIRKMRFFKTKRLLDLACGTSDLSILAQKIHGNIKVYGIDFSRKMLLKAKEKLEEEGLKDIFLFEGDAFCLPFKENTFDVSIIAFGLRNMKDKRRVIDEMIRVTHPSGQVMVLEMTMNGRLFLRPLFLFYIKKILPFVGGAISSHREAYSYLSDSIFEFLGPKELKELMEEEGLIDVKFYSLSWGITYLHVGNKPY